MASTIISVITLFTVVCNIIGTWFVMKNDIKHLAKDIAEMKEAIARLEELHLNN